MRIRTIQNNDAKSFYRFQRMLDQEAKYMLYEPNERTSTVREVKQFISTITASSVSTMFIAETDGEIVGYIGIYGSELTRIKHVVTLSIGILERYCNKGLGQALLQQAMTYATHVKLKRIELTVMVDNKRAIHVYEKHGFQREGVRKQSILLENKFHDELHMGLLL